MFTSLLDVLIDRFGHAHLGKMPWDALLLLFSLPDPALQPTVGEGVALVELKVTLIGEKAPTGFW